MPTNIKLPKRPKNYKGNGIKEKIIKNITFFGDSAIAEEDPIYKNVYNSARLLAQNDYTIVNGGGPGLMKAATDGAEEVDGNTVAIYWEPKLASFFEGKNLANIADETDSQSNYINRTFGLIAKGDAYVVCKGGTGTISEFGLVWALAKLYFGVHKPVILFGDFWGNLIEAIKSNMYIDEKELGVLYYAQTPEELLEILLNHEMRLDRTKLKKVDGDEAAFLLKPHVKEVVKSYNKTAHHYTSIDTKNLVSKPQLDDFISLINPPANVLDVGCGPGFDLKYLSLKYSVTAIEVSKRFVEIARFENPNVEIIHSDIVDYDLNEAKYKGIWARDSLHHVPDKDLKTTFKKLYESLVDDGILYVIVREGEREFTEIQKKSYGEVKMYYNLFTKEKLQNIAKETGFTLIKLDQTKRSHKWLIGVFKKD